MLNKFRLKRDKLFHRRSKGVIWTICIVLTTLVLFFGERHLHHHGWRDARIHKLLQLQHVQVSIGKKVRYLEEWLISLRQRHEWYTHYQQLLSQQQLFVAQKTQIKELQSEKQAMAKLLQLMGSDQEKDKGWTAASLINIPQNQFGYRFMINKGESDHIYQGQMVISEDGVVGRVDVATKQVSVILPVISPDNVVPVKIVRTERNCFCIGAGYDRLVLLNVPSSMDIKIGDQLVTSDLGGGWLPGYLVGEVRQIKKNSDRSFLTIEVKPAVDCWRLRSVILLQNNG